MTTETRHTLTLGLALTVGLTALSVTGCSPTVATHGHRLDEAALAQVEPGTTSREQVQSLLGSPSSLSTFDEDAWYYVSQRTERLSFYQEETVAQDVVTISFDDRGIVSDVDRHGLERAFEVTPVDRKTRTAGNELNVFEQFVGNIGRFNLPAGASTR